MEYCWIYDTFSLKQRIDVDDGRRDSDDENDASGCVKSDTVADTFKQYRKLQWTMEFRRYVCILSMVIILLLLCLTVLLILKSIAFNHSRLYYISSQVAMHQDVGGCYHS